MSWKSLITTKGGNASPAPKQPAAATAAEKSTPTPTANSVSVQQQPKTPVKGLNLNAAAAAASSSAQQQNNSNSLSAASNSAASVTVASPRNPASSGSNEMLRRGSVRAPPQAAPKQETKTLNDFRLAYIFWAEFDIDKGSVLQLQHPKKWPYNNPMYEEIFLKNDFFLKPLF